MLVTSSCPEMSSSCESSSSTSATARSIPADAMEAMRRPFISINTTERAAVVVTRIAALEYLGSKVCHGVYATQFDRKALEK